MESISVAMVGCAGTGKTSLAYSAGHKEKIVEVPTLTARRHEVALASARVELWEAPSWELLLEPEAHFARGCDAVLFVVDCTRRETLDEVLVHWLHVARYHSAAEAPFLFVGTKHDLVPEEENTLVRLRQLQLPAMVGSGLDETFACSALQELLWLRRAAGSGGGSREGPLLAPLAPLELPQALYDGSRQATPRPVRPRLQVAAPPAPAPEQPPWHIAADELSFSERLDGEGSWAGGGRSPSVSAKWRGMAVVAKRVERQLLERRGSEQRLRRLLQELQAHSCRHMAKFYGACLDTEPVCLVMEYMPGGDLERYLRSKRVELHRAWVPPRPLLMSWAVSAASAVAYLAELRVAHGNVRPSNLLLCTSLALRLSPSGALSPVEHRHQAELGAASLESCLYSAPEVLRGEASDEEQLMAADVFALGLVLWFMCTGARPLQHLDNDGLHKPPDHVMQAFKDGTIPRPPLSAVSQGPRMRQLIGEAWREAPARPSAEDLAAELRKLQAQSQGDSKCCCTM